VARDVPVDLRGALPPARGAKAAAAATTRATVQP